MYFDIIHHDCHPVIICLENLKISTSHISELILLILLLLNDQLFRGQNFIAKAIHGNMSPFIPVCFPCPSTPKCPRVFPPSTTGNIVIYSISYQYLSAAAYDLKLGGHIFMGSGTMKICPPCK